MKSKTAMFPAPPERAGVLAHLRNLKMARSPHAYVRGNIEQFYAWLASGPGASIPKGPPIWICGDCHAGNLGPIADAKGRTAIEIRDLDQTVIGNPAHDLVRLGLSLASAARDSDLPGVTTAQMLEQMTAGYEQAIAGEGTERLAKPTAVKEALENAVQRKLRHLARERVQDAIPQIPLGKKFWAISKEEFSEIETLFAEERVHGLLTSLRARDPEAAVRVLDAAFWVKGCSSLGRLRYAVLVSIGGKSGEVCLLDLKEAVPGVAPAYPRVKMPGDHAERVVTGARELAPALGERMLAGQLQGRSVYLRELLPQDLKIRLGHLTIDEATKVARFLATVVGQAHARQMKEETRRQWLADLGRQRTKTLDAPSWLWSGVVELMVSHEGAYLEHCRRYSAAGVAEEAPGSAADARFC